MINVFYSAMNVETLSQVKQNIVKEACSQLKLQSINRVLFSIFKTVLASNGLAFGSGTKTVNM